MSIGPTGAFPFPSIGGPAAAYQRELEQSAQSPDYQHSQNDDHRPSCQTQDYGRDDAPYERIMTTTSGTPFRPLRVVSCHLSLRHYLKSNDREARRFRHVRGPKRPARGRACRPRVRSR
jgi:hypothetical protein